MKSRSPKLNLSDLSPSTIRALITALVFLGVVSLFYFRSLDRFELVTYDYRMILRGERPSEPQIAVIEISDESIKKIGRWPWTRDWHAAMVKALTELGAKAIVFDVLFSESDDPTKDQIFSQVIADSKNVYLAEVVHPEAEGEARLTASLPEFSQNARAAGHINLRPDIDGVMRRIPLGILLDGKIVPQLSLAVYLSLSNAQVSDVQFAMDKVSLPDGRGSYVEVPLDHAGNFIINWVGRWKRSYKHFSYNDVIGSYAMKVKGLTPKIPLDFFKDKICFIGNTATGLFDIRPTPLEPLYPAVGVNLTVLNNLLERRFIRPLSQFQNALILMMIALFLFWLTQLKSFFRSALLTLLLALVYVVIACVIFIYSDIWINVFYPLLLIISVYFFVTLYNELSVTIERAKLLRLATRDSLTGLYNIGHFKLLMKAELQTLAMRPNKKISLVMGDVDHFKHTNDTYGHTVGDAVLREVAATVRTNCRALDVAARYGGEEIILLLSGADSEEAFKVADKIRIAISEKIFPSPKGEFKKTISMGVTQLSAEDSEKEIDQIVARADRALYEAKESGRNRVIIAKDSPKSAPNLT